MTGIGENTLAQPVKPPLRERCACLAKLVKNRLTLTTICLLNSSVKCLGCLGSLIYGPPVSCAPPGTVHISVANPQIRLSNFDTLMLTASGRAGAVAAGPPAA